MHQHWMESSALPSNG